MEKKIIAILSFALLLLAALIGYLIWDGADKHILYLGFLGAISFSFILLASALKDFFIGLKKKILQASHPMGRNRLTMEDIVQSHGQLSKKLTLSTQYITQLGTDWSGTIDHLIANDEIGKALIRIDGEMKRSLDQEKERKWVADGLSKLGGIIQVKGEIKEYSAKLISSLVDYLEAYQGCLFIKREDETEPPYLELLACYAYDTFHPVEKKIFQGQGTLGQAMLEKEIMHLTNIPKNYVKISSGLGSSVPRNSTIVPLLFSEQLQGAIELASFSPFQPFQLEFLKKVSDSIASEIGSIKNMEHVRKLLEESNHLASELKQREETMKSNEAELSGHLQAINNTIASAGFDLDGNFLSANTIFHQVTGFAEKEMIAKNFLAIFSGNQGIQMMWNSLREGNFFSGEFRTTSKDEKVLWLNGTFTPIAGVGGQPEKVMMYAQFTSKEKEAMHDLKSLVSAFKATLPIIELNLDGSYRNANELFCANVGLTKSDIRKRNIKDLLEPSFHSTFDELIKEVINKGSVSIELPFWINNTTAFYECSLHTLKNLEGIPTRLTLTLIKEVEETRPFQRSRSLQKIVFR
jgi:PAS domain S-box-containing protein